MLNSLKRFHTKPHDVEALDLLSAPSHYEGLPELDDRQIEYQLVLLPSFEPYRTWTVYKASDGARTVRRIVWHRKDFQATIAAPTTYGADGLLSKKNGDALIFKLSTIKVPAFRMRDAVVLDGITYGIWMTTSLCRTELSWWCEPPEGWGKLGEWHNDAMQTFNALLPARTPTV